LIFRLIRGWTPHVNVAFTCGPHEVFNIVIEPLVLEPSPEETQHFFLYTCQNSGFSNVAFGQILVDSKIHPWARYLAFDKVWSKKYMIVLHGKSYAITILRIHCAACSGLCNHRKLQRLLDVFSKGKGLGLDDFHASCVTVCKRESIQTRFKIKRPPQQVV
jgi:hypothetical protein